MEKRDLENLKGEIDRIVDDWLAGVVKERFTQKPVGQKPKSMWDRLKQGITNWWWGPKGDKYNPYAWRNRFGDELGAEGEVAGDPRRAKSEGFDPSIFTLQEYMEIRGLVDSLEIRLDESGDFENLRLMSLLRAAAVDLKNSLFSALSRHLMNLRQEPPKSSGESAAAPAEGGKSAPAGGSKSARAGGAQGSGSARAERTRGSGSAKGVTKMGPKKDINAEINSGKETETDTETNAGEEVEKNNEKRQKLEGMFRVIEDEKGNVKTVGEIFYEFLKIYMKKYEDKKTKLREWLSSEIGKLRHLEREEAEDALRNKIVKSNEFIEAISKIVGSTPKEVLDDMVKYVDSIG